MKIKRRYNQQLAAFWKFIDRIGKYVAEGGPMNSLDARAQYTRKMIEENFLVLLERRPVAKITVTELCRLAGINRATFYKHYLDVPDLLEKQEEHLFEQIRAIFSEEPMSLEGLLYRTLAYIRQEAGRYMALGSDNGDPGLMTKTFSLCYKLAYPIMEQNLPDIEEGKRQMVYYFLSHGSGGVVTCWIRNGMHDSPEEVTRLLVGLCRRAASIDRI